MGKTRRTFIVILSPLVQIPVELERQFVVIEHHLPEREQLQKIAEGVATEPGELPTGDELLRLLDTSTGLTRGEAENAYSLSLVRHSKLVPESVWDFKTQSLRKSGLLTLHRGGERFGNLGGMEALKTFCLRALGARQRGSLAKPHGVLLLGVTATESVERLRNWASGRCLSASVPGLYQRAGANGPGILSRDQQEVGINHVASDVPGFRHLGQDPDPFTVAQGAGGVVDPKDLFDTVMIDRFGFE